MKWLTWLLLIAVVIAGAFFVLGFCVSHGHIDELLVVTVRVVDGVDGRPLEGATVIVVRDRSLVGGDYFGGYLEDAVGRIGHEDAWRLGRIVAAARSTSEPITTVRSSAYVTRYWLGPIELSKDVFVPQVLLVDHPRHGRTVVPIDPRPPTPGEAPRTWRLYLGTVRIPSE